MNFLIQYLWKSPYVSLGIFLFLMGGIVYIPVTVFAEEDAGDLKGDIVEVEKKLEKEKKKKEELSQDLQVITGNLTATQLAIQKTQAHIETAQETITRKESEIVQLEKKLEEQKNSLQDMLQLLYDSSQTPVSEVIFHTSGMSQILDGQGSLLTFQEQIGTLIDESLDTKAKIESERDELTGVKQEKERLLEIQNSQKMALVQDKQETQGDIAEKEATIGELQGKLAEMQSDLRSLTGKSYNAKDIREAVEIASKETGVPKGVLYGFLKMETNLGANTGQCTYKEVEKVSIARYKKYGSKYAASIKKLYERKEIFYDIVKSLGYSKDKKVSCSPNYIGQGGAMGVSQFMSDVWKGYESRVQSKTGHKNPDPWDLTDGVMAMALKLQGAGAKSDSASAIKKASINYLGAFNTNYYNGIVYWSKNYKKLFD